jgi:hypothetical protein
MKAKISKIIEDTYGAEIAEKLLESYEEVQRNFTLGKWKLSELDAGHFVECTRRIIEQELFKVHTPFDQNLSKFDNSTLVKYENASGHESFRMLIPRALKTVSDIRNKRGVGHIGQVSANEIDATYIIYSVKWVFSEIIRINSKLSPDDTRDLVSHMVKRQVELVWEDSKSAKHVLDPRMDAARKILLLLLSENSPVQLSNLRQSIGYKNETNFTKIIKTLHRKCYLVFDPHDLTCELTPTGELVAEQIILGLKK